MDDGKKEPEDRPIEDVLEELAAEVPDEDWDKVPPSSYCDPQTAWEKLRGWEDQRQHDRLLSLACLLLVLAGVGIVIYTIAMLIFRWTG